MNVGYELFKRTGMKKAKMLLWDEEEISLRTEMAPSYRTVYFVDVAIFSHHETRKQAGFSLDASPPSAREDSKSHPWYFPAVKRHHQLW